MVLNKTDLDMAAAQGCMMGGGPSHHGPGEHEVFLHGRCHIDGPIEASYKEGSGVVTIRCRVCKKLIAEIQVAE